MGAIAIFAVITLLLLSEAYLKPAWFKYLTAVISLILGSFVAFNFHEIIAKMMINANFLPKFAYLISFTALLGLSFGVLKVLADTIAKDAIKIPVYVNKILSVTSAFLLAYIGTGLILVILLISPWSTKIMYKRFPSDAVIVASDFENSRNKSFLGFDDFVTGLFSYVSKGSLSSDKSFGQLHPNFCDENFLNKLDAEIPHYAGADSVSLPSDRLKAIKPIHKKLKNEDLKPVESSVDSELYAITVHFSNKKFEEGGVFPDSGDFSFTTSQIRLICNDKEKASKGSNVFPLGYIDPAKKVMVRRTLTEKLSFKKSDFTIDNKFLEMTFIFEVPKNANPSAIGFRQNVIIDLPKPKKAKKNSEGQEDVSNDTQS